MGEVRPRSGPAVRQLHGALRVRTVRRAGHHRVAARVHPGAAGGLTVRLRDVRLRGVRLGDLRLRGVRGGDLLVRSVRLGALRLRSVRLGDLRLRGVRLGDLRLRDVWDVGAGLLVFGGYVAVAVRTPTQVTRAEADARQVMA